MSRIRVGIREAQTYLGRFLRLVQRGNEILLTDRGRPVGKIVPLAIGDLALEDRIARLVEKGVLEPLLGKRLRRLPPPLAGPGGVAQRMLQEDRQ